MKYNHVLALNPYFRDSIATMGIFPPTGLEYIATNMKDLVGKITLLDLRYEKEYRDVNILANIIKKEIDLLCISITWNSQFNAICDLICKLPHEVTTVVGGHKATEEVESLFDRCPNIDLIVRGEGEETLREIVKGVLYQVRDAFKIFNNYHFYIHGYFIYGNIGETEEEMVYIAQFAKELKLDSISFQKLRIEKYSPLKEVVDNTPGYHYDSIGGAVYSDLYRLKDLKRIRDRIKFGFYRFGQIGRILQKAYKARLLTKFDLMHIFIRLPKILFRLAKRELEKKGWPAAP